MKFIWKCIIMGMFLSILACHESQDTRIDSKIIFPDDSHTIIQIHDKENFLKQIENNIFWKDYLAYLPDENIKKVIKSIPETPIFVAYTDKNVYCITTRAKDTTHIWKNSTSNQVDSLLLDNQKWFFINDGEKRIISTSSDIKNFTKNIKVAHTQEVYLLQKTISKDILANLYLNNQKTQAIFSKIIHSNVMDYISEWTAWDIVLEKDKIALNGTTFNKKEEKSVGLLVNSTPIELQSIDLIPSQTQHVSFYTFSEISDITWNDNISDFCHSVQEIAIASLSKEQKKVAIVTASDIEEVLQYLSVLKTEIYQEKEIHILDENAELKAFLSVFEDTIPIKYALLYNSSLVFAENIDILKDMVNDIQTHKVISKDILYQQLTEHTISKASYTELSNLNKNQKFSNEYPTISNTYYYTNFQITPQNEYYILNFTSIIPQQKEQPRGSLTQKAKILLDTEAKINPKWVVNHQTHRKEIVIQDIENNLYLINSNGKILWKRKLDGGINSDIFQVDLFKNGFLQLAFSTEKSVWVLDRNGNKVGSYPMSSQQEVLPLQVYDYDETKEYRLAFSNPTNIQLLDNKGNIIRGFEKQQVTSSILHTPVHFRVNGRDYLCFTETHGKIHFIHRNGKERILIKDRFNFSNNDIYLLNDWFSFTTKEGKQVYIDTKGGIRIENRNLSEYHWITYKYNTEAIISDNILFIDKKPILLPYGIYSKPKIFKIGKIIYISVTDLQNNKIFVLNSDGEILPHFPVFGSSPIDVTIDNGKPLFTFLKDKYSLYVYEF